MSTSDKNRTEGAESFEALVPLRDTFSSEDSRTDVTVVVIDQANATEAQEKLSEAAWLPQLGWMYDTSFSIARRLVPGVVIKGLGDGFMLVFPSDEATQAIMTAIQILEAINEANEGPGGARGAIDFYCYAAITTGKAVAFRMPDGSPDFVGSTVNKAHRLCGVANARALFIDRATAAAANMVKVSSRVGEVLRRTPEEYQGDLQKVPVKGISQPVEYYEILWDTQLYGLKSEAITRNTDRLRAVRVGEPQRAGAEAGTVAAKREERQSGKVTNWFKDKGFGFITGHDGEEFYFSRNALVYPEDFDEIETGRRVVFTVQDTPAPGKKRRAGGLLIVGSDAEGVLVKMAVDKGYCWIRVHDPLGHRHDVYLRTAEGMEFRVGDTLAFRVGANEKGSVALDVTAADGAAAA